MVFNCNGVIFFAAVLLCCSQVMAQNSDASGNSLNSHQEKRSSIGSKPDYFLKFLETNTWMAISILALIIFVFMIETLVVVLYSRKKDSKVECIEGGYPPPVRFFSYRNIRHPYYSI